MTMIEESLNTPSSNPVARVISGFPGIGKTGLFSSNEGRVSDSDSSQFAKGEGFSAEYVKHIQHQRTLPNISLVLVSSHDVVRAALVDAGIPFTLAYPEIGLKDEYLQRYRDRGNSEAFLVLMEGNWEIFITECEAQIGCDHLRIKSGQFLSDVVSVP